MASRINEELMNTNLDIPDGEIKIEGRANPVYADAINVHNKKKKEVEKTLKDKKPELKKPFLGTKGNTTIMPKTPEMKKLKLSEEMFKGIREHMADAPEAYEGIFRVIDNMEHIINYISDLTEEELNYEDMKQSYDILEEAMDEFKGYLGELKPTVRESKKRRPVKESTAVLDRPRDKAIALQDKRNNKDIWSDIYNELCGDIKDLEAPHRKLKRPPTQRYDSYTVAPSHRDDSIRVNANEESELDFAKEVADTYGVEYRIIEHTSRFAPHKYEMRIYPGKKVANEGLTRAQRHNRNMDRIWNYKKQTDAKMIEFIRANSDATEEEIKKAQDDDKVSLLLKNLGLHDAYWSKNESLNEAQCNYVDTYNGATIYECEGKYSADVPDYNGKYSHSKRVVADSVEELKKKIDDADRQYRKDLEYTNESVKKRSRRVAGKALFNEDLKIYRESDLTDFEFWSGARDTVKYLTDDEIRQICQTLEDIYPDGCTETEINDFFWFEDDTIAEWLGYNSFEEIMERDNEE
jgi:hypothetical protein